MKSLVAVACFALLVSCGKKADSAAGGENTAPTPVMVETAVNGAVDRVVTAERDSLPCQSSQRHSENQRPG